MSTTNTFPARFLTVLIVLVILLSGTSFYFYRKSKAAPASQAQLDSLVEKVGKLVVLPEDEVPTIATVSDPSALQDQEFFAGAKKGDKVLIYAKAGKAILYDPVVGKVITIAPLKTGDVTPSTADTTTQSGTTPTNSKP